RNLAGVLGRQMGGAAVLPVRSIRSSVHRYADRQERVVRHHVSGFDGETVRDYPAPSRQDVLLVQATNPVRVRSVRVAGSLAHLLPDACRHPHGGGQGHGKYSLPSREDGILLSAPTGQRWIRNGGQSHLDLRSSSATAGSERTDSVGLTSTQQRRQQRQVAVGGRGEKANAGEAVDSHTPGCLSLLRHPVRPLRHCQPVSNCHSGIS
ncbi:hypothetical protein BaRGS_00002851, partial [Batillaria attramentaria]